MCEGEKTGSRWLHAAEKKDLRHRTSRYDSIFSHPDFQKRAQADAQASGRQALGLPCKIV